MSNDDTDFEALKNEMMKDQIVRCSYFENELRRRLAQKLEEVRVRSGISMEDLAKKADLSDTHIRRVFHLELGGALPLYALVRVADALDVVISFRIFDRATPGLDCPYLSDYEG